MNHSTDIQILYPKIQQQKNGRDCGLLALAYAVETVMGKDLMETRFNTQKMRSALLDGLRNEAIKYFPTTGGRPRAIETPLSVVKKAVVK